MLFTTKCWSLSPRRTYCWMMETTFSWHWDTPASRTMAGSREEREELWWRVGRRELNMDKAW